MVIRQKIRNFDTRMVTALIAMQEHFTQRGASSHQKYGNGKHENENHTGKSA